jgi:putative hydrolases of HD superfamily
MSSDLLAFFRTVAKLKRTPRTGWLDRGIPPAETESVADHTLLTALIAWTLALDDPALDADRVLKLGMVHDIAEAIVGDIPPYRSEDIPDASEPEALRAFFSVRRKASPEAEAEKHAVEQAAAAKLFAMLPERVATELRALWEEYEARATPEARFVKDVDRLEAFLQSRSYAKTYRDAPLKGFTDMALNGIDHPILKAIRDKELETL